ncbi:MAG: NAD(P)/FAD-dependent oxidoreductase [Desulfarculaceae bacterium]|nr:NAD(P)/FAD-dependent oxidoreductase [Desulfarculaceae bacterium]MCF8071733.1 NAD(P)/FAD-dependent oxidoreductase [Desulfarculaceae bacterium]MCF8102420.1 NAD(P)/FAD-dependent oxidoreductase [Desulfarculaceae bacterium]
MKRCWDAIVVGLGPAGAAAACELAEAGRRVLVLDGAPARAKPCGGCLSDRGLEALAWLEPPAWLREHPVRRLWIGFPGKSAAQYVSPRVGAWLVERARLDAWLAGRARQAGAEVLPARASRLSRENGLWQARGKDGAWRAPWLVLASGAGARLADALPGLEPGQWRFAALVSERPLPPGMEPYLRDAGLLELGGVAGGYGWAFGRGGVLNLGIAGLLGRDQGGPGGLHRRMEAFTRRLGLEPMGAPRGAMIPCPHRRRLVLAQGRAALVGDAAGLADPVLGEGIAQAVASGRMAARAILAGDLGLYQKRAEATLLRDHHHARLLARLIYRFPAAFHGLARRRPGGVELGFNWLRGELAPVDMWGALARGFLGRAPRLARFPGAYYSSPLD